MSLPRNKAIVLQNSAHVSSTSIFPDRTIRTISSVTPASLDRVRVDAVKHSDIGLSRDNGKRVYAEKQSSVKSAPRKRTKKQVIASRAAFDVASKEFMKKHGIHEVPFYTMLKLYLDFKIKNKIPDRRYVEPQSIQMFILRAEHKGKVNLTADKVLAFASWVQGHVLE